MICEINFASIYHCETEYISHDFLKRTINIVIKVIIYDLLFGIFNYFKIYITKISMLFLKKKSFLSFKSIVSAYFLFSNPTHKI